MIEFDTRGYKNHFIQGTQPVGPNKAEKIRGILNPLTWFHGWFGVWKCGFSFNEGGWPLNMTLSLSHPTARERNVSEGGSLYVYFFGVRLYRSWDRSDG